MLGRSYRSGAVDPTAVGWSHYRCGTASACETRHAGSDGWTDWTTTTRSEVLASTAGWTWRSTERPHADRDVARIARHSVESTDGLQGSHVVDGYTGTLEHVAFGTGFERYTDWSPLSNRAFPDTDNFFNKWAGVQGTVPGALPDESARWSGLMLGYQGGRAAGETPFVEGRASIQFSLSDNNLDVAFSEVASRDGRRTLRDFAFNDLQVEQVGTFGRDGAEGTMDGALYGPSQGEVAGAFHHNASNVTGSFGARRLPDTAAHEESDASETRPAAIVDVDDSRYVGADAAPALDRLTAAGDYSGVAVSSGPASLLAKPAPPVEHQVDVRVVAPRHNRHGNPGLVALRYDPALLGIAPATTKGTRAFPPGPRILHCFRHLRSCPLRPWWTPNRCPLPIAQPRLITLIREGGPPRRLTQDADETADLQIHHSERCSPDRKRGRENLPPLLEAWVRASWPEAIGSVPGGSQVRRSGRRRSRPPCVCSRRGPGCCCGAHAGSRSRA